MKALYEKNWEADTDLLQTDCNDQQIQTDCIIYSQVNIKTDMQTEKQMQAGLL